MVHAWTVIPLFVVLTITIKVKGENSFSENDDVPLALSRVKRDLENDEPDYSGIDKKSLGRWKNFRYLLGNRDDKRFFGHWKNTNYLWNNQRQDEDPEEIDKRFIGRWKNRNWRLQQLRPNTADDKRFFGRWKNRNYQLAQLQDDQDIDKRFFGRWKNRNYILAKLNEENSLD